MVKRPQRPVWLSSDGRTVSSRGPVLTPAEERALAQGRDPDAQDDTEHPLAEVVEVPEGGRVDPS